MIRHVLVLSLLIAGSSTLCFGQQTESAPSDTTTFKLRDAYLGKEPLYVMDGKIVDKETIDGLQPGTIERIDVLKDEAATSMYGEMGKNGVVVFTSKGQPKQGVKKSKQRKS